MSNLAARTTARSFSGKITVRISESVQKLLDNGEVNPRKHPGITKPKVVKLPNWALKGFQAVLAEDRSPEWKSLLEDGKKLQQRLSGRHAPLEGQRLEEQVEKVRSMLGPVTECGDIEPSLRGKARRLLKQSFNHWRPISYNKRGSLLYFIARGAQDYAVLYRVLNEINVYEEKLKPKTLLDFGSGVGTVLWAASHLWSDSLKEYVCIDASSDMNDLSERLRNYADPKIEKVFYRQFLSSLPNPTFDVVVSAYSLLELPSMKSRLEILTKLWNKSESYLVIVEHGTNAGFEVVNEARDFVLNYLANSPENNRQGAHVFSPCPHDLSCPRYTTDDSPCNFEVSYVGQPFEQRQHQLQIERYAYVILKKGPRSECDHAWPRLVRPVLKRSSHTICRMCTASGELKELVLSKSKHERNVYRCARKSTWGDRLPFHFEDEAKVVAKCDHITGSNQSITDKNTTIVSHEGREDEG